MRRLCCLLLVLAVAPLRPAAAQSRAQPRDAAPSPPRAPLLDTAALADFVRVTARRARVPGAAVVVVRGDSVLARVAVGGRTGAGTPLTPDTPALLGSTSKAFTGAVVLNLVRDGRLDLDVPVTAYLPRLRFANSDALGVPTLRQMLHHRSGLRERDGFVPLAEPIDWESGPVARVSLAGAPGTVYDYSNLNYSLAALAAEAVTGARYADLVARYVAAPLGLAHTTATASDLGDSLAQGHRFWYVAAVPARERYRRTAVPAGFVAASAHDLARFAAAFADTASARRIGLTPDLLRMATSGPEGDLGYGAGWRRARWDDGTPIVQHTGLVATASSAMAVLPEADAAVAVVVPANSLGAASALAEGAVHWVRGEPVEPPRPMEPWVRLVAGAGLVSSAWGAVRAAAALARRDAAPRLPSDGRPYLRAAWDLGVPAALVVGVPLWTDTPLGMMLDAQPDLGWALVGGAALSVTAGVLRLVTPR